MKVFVLSNFIVEESIKTTKVEDIIKTTNYKS